MTHSSPVADYLYHYRARLVSIVDADTLDLQVDLGFRMRFQDRFRLYGIDAWELRGPGREKGLQAKIALQQLLAGHEWFDLHTIQDKRGKYGRWLAVIYLDDGTHVNDWLRIQGHCKPES